MHSGDVIPIKKTQVKQKGKDVDVFVIPAIAMKQSDGSSAKIPHPYGHDNIVFRTLDEAIKKIDLAGFGYAVDSKEVPSKVVRESIQNLTLYDAISPLIELLNDANSSVVVSAAYALGEIKSREAIEPLIAILGKEDQVIRHNACEALGKIGLPALRLLIESLESDDWVTRNSAAIGIGEIIKYHKVNIKVAVPSLVSLLKDEKWIVRASVAHTLGKIAAYLSDLEYEKYK